MLTPAGSDTNETVTVPSSSSTSSGAAATAKVASVWSAAKLTVAGTVKSSVSAPPPATARSVSSRARSGACDSRTVTSTEEPSATE